MIALTYAVGTDTHIVIEALSSQLKRFNYITKVIKISQEILQSPAIEAEKDSFIRTQKLMDAGNELRKSAANCGVLSLAAINKICVSRTAGTVNPEDKEIKGPIGHAFIISSLKHPDEVEKLREVYSNAFFLFAINESETSRYSYLIEKKNMRKEDAKKLIARDEGERIPYGQHTRGVFEMADAHLTLNPMYTETIRKSGRERILAEEKLLREQVSRQVARCLNLIFGHPFITPTFDEYAMFMAYSSGLRSADLSRQIGAVITNKSLEIVSTGANDVPCFGGGQYWPDPETFEDAVDGRDYKKGYDTNRKERMRIVNEIIEMIDFGEDAQSKEALRKKLLGSSIKYLTEYSRPVHAEMSAIIACARSGVSLDGATLYCSTFPCHNCAKHIINAGITRVVFIEPYPKSRTIELYSDSATITREDGKVRFEEFVGIGPRRFFDLFSLKLSSGRSIIRQNDDGTVYEWDQDKARLRCPLISSYTEKEMIESAKWLLFEKQSP